jgi:hypothetical protein
MPNSTTNPPVEIAIPPWTIAVTAPAATATPTAWRYNCSRVFAAGSCVSSGVNVVSGAATTSLTTVRVFLLDLGGNILASSAVAGQALINTAYTVNAVPFSTPYALVGPQAYFIAVQTNATVTDVISGVAATVPPAGFLGGPNTDTVATSFATPTSGAITPPVVYTSAKAPVVSLY